MTTEEGAAFAAWWSPRFGALAPLGHILRLGLDERWLRIHALPDGKRYAETDAEHAEVLHRAHTMARELFVPGEPVWLVSCRHDDAPAPSIELAGLALALAGQFEPGSDEATASAYAARTAWPHAGVDTLIAEIAAWRTDALWACIRTGEVLAPYDGGIDLIVSDRARRDELVQRHLAWRSSHPRGL